MRQVALENKFCVVAHNCWLSSAWHWLHITLLESRIFEDATTFLENLFTPGYWGILLTF